MKKHLIWLSLVVVLILVLFVPTFIGVKEQEKERVTIDYVTENWQQMGGQKIRLTGWLDQTFPGNDNVTVAPAWVETVDLPIYGEADLQLASADVRPAAHFFLSPSAPSHVWLMPDGAREGWDRDTKLISTSAMADQRRSDPNMGFVGYWDDRAYNSRPSAPVRIVAAPGRETKYRGYLGRVEFIGEIRQTFGRGWYYVLVREEDIRLLD